MTEENWSVSRNIFLESIMHETESDRKNLCIYYRYFTHEGLHPFTYFQRTLITQMAMGSTLLQWRIFAAVEIVANLEKSLHV